MPSFKGIQTFLGVLIISGQFWNQSFKRIIQNATKKEGRKGLCQSTIHIN